MKIKRAINSKVKLNKIMIASGLVLGLAVIPAAVFADSNSANTTVNANIGSTISISTSGTVSINVTPVTGGAQTSAKDTVTVSTNNSSGYNLVLADADSDTKLVNSGASSDIDAHAGTQASPTALANNRWGYRVDGIGGFSTGGAVETNVTSSSITYAGMPASGSGNTIKTTSSVAAGDTTDVWYAVKADTSKPNGIYTDTVTYTASTNL